MRWAASTVAVAVVLLPACTSSDKVTPAPPTTSAANATSTPHGPATSSTSVPEAQTLRILVTNDDGVASPGIDALVEALRDLPGTEVTVVAPATNQSGAGGKVTSGPTPVADATTASGYAAKAVTGFPADSIVWSFDKFGVPTRPHVVISGINQGQNLGTYVDISGTVGAARAAAQRGVPALAVSQGFGDPPDYPSGVTAALAWLAAHRAALLARDVSSTVPATVTNLNIPTCPAGKPRPTPAVEPPAGADAKPFGPVDCTTAYGTPTSDVDAFLHGYVAQTDNLPLTAAVK
jgi:5'-nucleotidase